MQIEVKTEEQLIIHTQLRFVVIDHAGQYYLRFFTRVSRNDPCKLR